MDAPSAQSVKLARIPLPAAADDEQVLAALQRTLQPVVADALRAVRAAARDADKGKFTAADAVAATAKFLLATSSSAHRQALQLRADIRSERASLLAEQQRAAMLVERLAGAREALDANSLRAADLRASDSDARGAPPLPRGRARARMRAC
jgi:hypothetical protein